MPGCVLRVVGRAFDVDDYLSGSPLNPCHVWRAGEPRSGNRPPHDDSGLNILVSDAPADDLAYQVEDAISFLTAHHGELGRLMASSGVDGAVLDFGIERRDVVVQCDTLPAPLIRLAGGLGLAIEMSQYPVATDTGEV